MKVDFQIPAPYFIANMIYSFTSAVLNINIKALDHYKLDTALSTSFIETVYQNFAKFTGIHRRQSSFFNKFGGLRPATSFKSLWSLTQVFSYQFHEIFKNTFFKKLFGTTASVGPKCFSRKFVVTLKPGPKSILY